VGGVEGTTGWGGIGGLGSGATETVCSRGAGGGATGRGGGTMPTGGIGASEGREGAVGKFMGGTPCGAAPLGGDDGAAGIGAGGRIGVGAGAVVVGAGEPVFWFDKSCNIALMRPAFGACGWSAMENKVSVS